MDANKQKKLEEIKYAIKRCCGLCIYSKIEPHQEWGTCDFHEYDHEKHTQSKRYLSINRFGSCDSWNLNRGKEPDLGAYLQFLETTDE